MHLHLVVVGTLFFWPIVGIDPVPGRVGYPARMLLVVLTLPFHAFLGVTIMGQETLLGGDHYLALRELPGYGWLPDPSTTSTWPAACSGRRRPGRAGAVRRALRAVGPLVDEGGGARGPAARPARSPRPRRRDPASER